MTPDANSKMPFPATCPAEVPDHIVMLVCVASRAGQFDFIRVQVGAFVDSSCREFTFSGYNAWKVASAPSELCWLQANT